MRKPDLTALTARLEEYLGCPPAQAGRVRNSRVMELGEREPYPYESVQMLSGWGVLEPVPVRDARSAAPARLAATPQEATDAQG
jgi:hypothetical protein